GCWGQVCSRNVGASPAYGASQRRWAGPNRRQKVCEGLLTFSAEGRVFPDKGGRDGRSSLGGHCAGRWQDGRRGTRQRELDGDERSYWACIPSSFSISPGLCRLWADAGTPSCAVTI